MNTMNLNAWSLKGGYINFEPLIEHMSLGFVAGGDSHVYGKHFIYLVRIIRFIPPLSPFFSSPSQGTEEHAHH